ncbi:hypothetical protein [Geomicrobium sediminis]|uniref:Thioredoxin domain-containing protein n=1 Tax=Geomicrobium sediminis TaxID=1347788 RepID=A0ABS2PH74_9BACL|nr:hypothetical protein [Geomicrobium sediminis]MBM7634617.1 hypothetical protein [Geomicrobium sediminis]
MKTKWQPLVAIAVLMAGCGTNPTPGSEATNHIGDPEDMTAGYVMEMTESSVILDLSPAHQKYVQEELEQDFTDMMLRTLEVEITDELDFIDRDGAPIDPEIIEEGDRLRLDFDMADYDATESPVEMDFLVYDPKSDEEIIAEHSPSEEGYHLAIVYSDDDNMENVDEQEVEKLMQSDNLLQVYYLHTSEEKPATNFKNVFDLDTTPAFVVLDSNGVVNTAGSIEEVENSINQ